jgi:hypothetical protein
MSLEKSLKSNNLRLLSAEQQSSVRGGTDPRPPKHKRRTRTSKPKFPWRRGRPEN